MAPKKKKGKKGGAKKGGKKGGGSDGAEGGLSMSDENLLLKAQIESLKNELIFEKSRYSEAFTAMKEFRCHYELLAKEFEEEKSKTFLITANMTRQYKLMRDELLKKTNELSRDLEAKCLEIEQMTQKQQQLNAMHEAEMERKDKQLLDTKTQMDEMAHQFGQMLRQTLDKMSEKIVVNNNEMTSNTLSSLNIPSMLLQKQNNET